jgi:hypothetical protein
MKRAALLLLCCAAFATGAQAQAPCCSVTAINAATGIVSAKVNANGEAFQFRVANLNLLKELRIGVGVYANFATHEVSLDGKTIAGPITSGPASAPVTAPAPKPALPPPASAPVARPAPTAAPPTPTPSAGAPIAAPPARALADREGSPLRASTAQLPVMAVAIGTIQRSTTASPSSFSGTRPRIEARTLTAAVNGNSTNAHVEHIRGLDGIQQAQGLPDGVKELLMMHIKTLPAGESDDYIVNTDLAAQWAKTHPVSAAVKKAAQDTDSHTGCKSFSMHCAGEAEEHAAGQASDVLKQAKDDWDHSAGQLGHDWGVAVDQVEACFADHVTNPVDIPVEFSLNLPSLITLDSNDVNTVLKAIKVVNQINSGQSPLDVATGASKPSNSTSASSSGQASGESGGASPFSGSMKGQIVFGFPLLSSAGTVVHADFSYIPCLSFFLRPHNVGVSGTLNVETAITGNTQLNGQYNHTIPLPPADLHIPLQVLPIVIPPSGPPILEMDLSLFVQGFLQITGKGQISTSFNLDYAHSTDFDFTCSGKGCVQNRLARSQVTKVPLPPASAAATNTKVTGEIQIQPKIFTGIELNVEFDALQARVGPEATLEGDVQGDACLATNGASRTTSDALLAELGWTPSIRADTLIINKQVGDGYDHPLEQERMMAFQDLLQGRGGSSALTPALSGNAKLTPGQSAVYNIKMPSCYPYTEPVTYRVAWTGGVTPGVNSPGPTAGTKACAPPAQASTPPSELNCVFDPKQALALSFAWPQASTTDYTITVEAVGDQLGRKFSSAKPAVLPVSVAAK